MRLTPSELLEIRLWVGRLIPPGNGTRFRFTRAAHDNQNVLGETWDEALERIERYSTENRLDEREVDAWRRWLKRRIESEDGARGLTDTARRDVWT